MSDYQFTAYRIDEFSNKTLYRALKLRSDVFVVEQNCVYPDLDDKDIHQSSIHLLCHSTSETDEQSSVIAYARCLAPGISYSGSSIGRVVVAQPMRGKGLAQQLMTEAISVCRTQWPSNAIQIGAQVYLQNFYQALGFSVFSEPYDEDGIMHIDMQL